jgi:NADH-quinone oxidoreductase subunit B
MEHAGGCALHIERTSAGACAATPGDLMWVVGTITRKQAPRSRIYEQMADPKYVIAFGTCARAAASRQLHDRPGIEVIPVDVHPWLSAAPEAVLDGLMLLMEDPNGDRDPPVVRKEDPAPPCGCAGDTRERS